MATFAAIAIGVLFDLKISLFEENGLLVQVNTLIGPLTGFYVAGLAAIATFQNGPLDNIMKGSPPELKQIRGGKEFIEKLTRRRFLAIVFGYLVFLSFSLFLAGIFAVSLLADPADGETSAVRLIFLSIYSFGLTSLIMVTLLSLHYLIDRIHRD